jgi:hypothetical protein
MFLSHESIEQREKELIKSIPQTEILGKLPVKAKISAPNLELKKKKGKK